jgi:hypothetical protein
MKKLLFQLDTDPIASAFDGVAAYDGGIDHLMAFPGMSPDNVEGTVHGAIFTRGGKNKQYTAIFVGGSNRAQGEALFDAVKQIFFSNFRVSLMFDSNGCNTTAAAAVAQITTAGSLAGKKAVVLAGTGPVGQRGAVLLAQEGAEVILTSRKLDRAEAACQHTGERFGVSLTPMQVSDAESTQAALAGAQVVLAAGAAGIQLLPQVLWQDNPTLEILADINTVPPMGIEGVDMMDKSQDRDGKKCFGGLGIGGLKMKVHRAAISQLFEANDQVLDAEAIHALAKALV